MTAHGERNVTTASIFNLVTRWSKLLAPRPGRFIATEKDPSIQRISGWLGTIHSLDLKI